jgi:hypothetical protein
MEDDIEEMRLEKQTFLREAIISGGYDPSTFKNYIESLREDGKKKKYYIGYYYYQKRS